MATRPHAIATPNNMIVLNFIALLPFAQSGGLIPRINMFGSFSRITAEPDVHSLDELKSASNSTLPINPRRGEGAWIRFLHPLHRQSRVKRFSL